MQQGPRAVKYGQANVNKRYFTGGHIENSWFRAVGENWDFEKEHYIT